MILLKEARRRARQILNNLNILPAIDTIVEAHQILQPGPGHAPCAYDAHRLENGAKRYAVYSANTRQVFLDVIDQHGYLSIHTFHDGPWLVDTLIYAEHLKRMIDKLRQHGNYRRDNPVTSIDNFSFNQETQTQYEP